MLVLVCVCVCVVCHLYVSCPRHFESLVLNVIHSEVVDDNSLFMWTARNVTYSTIQIWNKNHIVVWCWFGRGSGSQQGNSKKMNPQMFLLLHEPWVVLHQLWFEIKERSSVRKIEWHKTHNYLLNSKRRNSRTKRKATRLCCTKFIRHVLPEGLYTRVRSVQFILLFSIFEYPIDETRERDRESERAGNLNGTRSQHTNRHNENKIEYLEKSLM